MNNPGGIRENDVGGSTELINSGFLRRSDPRFSEDPEPKDKHPYKRRDEVVLPMVVGDKVTWKWSQLLGK